MDLNEPECSQYTNSNVPENQETQDKNPAINSSEQVNLKLNMNTSISTTSQAPQTFSLQSTLSRPEIDNYNTVQGSVSLIIQPGQPIYQSPITCQPHKRLQSALSAATSNQPHSLFLQALSKLNESSMSLAGLNQLKNATHNNDNQTIHETGDVTPPDSLTSAPPSYSFVLRQMAARRRPRLMGTFIPSPSFVQQAPPPNYATAFDIYVDNRITTPSPRVYNFGFASMPAICPECGYTGMTVITSKITLGTHMCAFILCLLCCWICAPLPYILRSCKDVYHYCPNCRSYLGMYCPTNPDNNLT